MREEAELSWNLDEYLRHEVDPPERIEAMPEACEGDLMTEDEIADYISDGILALMVLQDKGSDRFEAVQKGFFADLNFLVSIGRLAPEDCDDIMKPENYRF